jgi:hypothetical protein
MDVVQLLPRPAGKPVAEDDAVQVVGLVLKATGEQASTEHLDRVAEGIDAATCGLVRPGQLYESAREGKAALV